MNCTCDFILVRKWWIYLLNMNAWPYKHHEITRQANTMWHKTELFPVLEFHRVSHLSVLYQHTWATILNNTNKSQWQLHKCKTLVITYSCHKSFKRPWIEEQICCIVVHSSILEKWQTHVFLISVLYWSELGLLAKTWYWSPLRNQADSL